MINMNIKKNTGLIILIISFILNAVLVQLQIGGLVRELARLGVIVGLVMIIISWFKSKKRTT